MRRVSILVIAFVAVATASWAPNANAGFNLGAGVHYLRAMGDIDTNDPDLSKDSFGIVGSAQLDAGLITIEGNLEYIFNYIGTDEGMWEPSAYALIGGLIYGGAGIGTGNFDGEWTDPWYALRAGVNLPLGSLGLDLYTTYRFWSDDDLKNLTGDDLDSLTFSAILRFGM
jgi:hypothetical protein